MIIDRYHKHPKYLRKAIDKAMLNAVRFFEEHYPEFDMSQFSVLTIKLSNTCRFAKYVSWKKTIRIESDRTKWKTYDRKTIGVAADWVHIDLIASLSVQLIHEMTHHIQYVEDRNFSEVETTKNEIEWMRVHRPQFHNKLRTI